MNTSISLHQQLLSQGRNLFDLGRLSESRRKLVSLLRLADVARDLAGEARQLLAEIELECGNYGRARRHVAAAIAGDSRSPVLYSLLAQILELDLDADPRRALKARKRAVRLDPANARAWSALGWSYVRNGMRKRAWQAFARCLSIGAPSVDTLADAVEGLLTLNRLGDAEQAIRVATFRHRQSPELKILANRVKFERSRQDQANDQTEPAILSFTPRTNPARTPVENPAILRADCRMTAAPHLLKMRGPRRAN